MQSDRNLLKQALEALENFYDYGYDREDGFETLTALRERLAQPEQEPQHDYRTRYDRGCYKCRSHYCPADCPEPTHLVPQQPEQEPVAHSIVAGALFDFMGWLTTRPERLVLSSTDNAGPAADAIKDFAQMRSLSINDAQVQEWQEHLTTPPRREWVGLTEGELAEFSDAELGAYDLCLEVEAKLKEKNA